MIVLFIGVVVWLYFFGCGLFFKPFWNLHRESLILLTFNIRFKFEFGRTGINRKTSKRAKSNRILFIDKVFFTKRSNFQAFKIEKKVKLERQHLIELCRKWKLVDRDNVCTDVWKFLWLYCCDLKKEFIHSDDNNKL